jgi:hypothetical protein
VLPQCLFCSWLCLVLIRRSEHVRERFRSNESD